MKARFVSCRVSVGGSDYVAIVRVLPVRAAAKVGADSPRYLDPGAASKVRLVRILRDAIDMTDELTYWTRQAIEREALRMAKARACIGSGALAFDVEKAR